MTPAPASLAEDLTSFGVKVSLALVVFGLLFVFLGRRGIRAARQFRSVAQRAPGVVTDLRFQSVDGSADGAWYPVLRFATADGRHVDTTAMYGRIPAPARRGDAVTVLYDPADPTRATLEGSAGTGTFLGALFTGLGLTFALLGLTIAGVVAAVKLNT